MMLAAPEVSATLPVRWATRETVSNEVGNYAVPLLEPGAYNLPVEKGGFSALIQNGLTLHVDQLARIDLQLQLGTVKESILVTAEVLLLLAGLLLQAPR